MKLTTVLMLGFLSSSAMAQDDLHIYFDIPPVLVHGFPALVSVTLQNDGKTGEYLPQLDFATNLRGNSRTCIQIEFSDGNSTWRVGEAGLGLVDDDWGRQGDVSVWSLGQQTTGTISFDLSQILMSPNLKGGSLPRPGQYEVTVVAGALKGRSSSRQVTIREPTADERRFLDAMLDQGIWRQWFPAVVLDDNLIIPDDIPLTEDTSPIRDFISLLRLSIRNNESSEVGVTEKTKPWGYLKDIVSELSYEKLVSEKGSTLEAVRVERTSLEANLGTKGRVTRQNSIGGVIEHFKAEKASEKWRLSASRNLDYYYASNAVKVQLSVATTLVDGFPAPVSITFVNNKGGAFVQEVPTLDFAVQAKPDIASAFKIVVKGKDTTRTLDFDRGGGGGINPSIGTKAKVWGRSPVVTLSFDLVRLIIESSRETDDHLPTGNYVLSVVSSSGERLSPPVSIKIREPTLGEMQFISAMGQQRIHRPWFPDVVTRQDLKLPDDILLTNDTACIRDYIELLRLAVRDVGGALSSIDAREESWGPLKDLVIELRYECLVKSRGARSDAAMAFRRQLFDEETQRGRIMRIDQIGGVLDHFMSFCP